MIPQINIDTDPRVDKPVHPIRVPWSGEFANLYRVKIADDFFVHVLRISFSSTNIKETKWKSKNGDPAGGLDEGLFRLSTAWKRYQKNKN